MLVFYVDDDPEDQEIFIEALKTVDPAIDCITANDGKEAYDLLTDYLVILPDIIFLDINMPIMDGLQCLTLLRSDRKIRNIPVIVYSTAGSEDDTKMYQKCGAGYLKKQNNFNDLVEALAEILKATK
ncbi:MAG: response regulator [Bacteroidota bacterium]